MYKAPGPGGFIEAPPLAHFECVQRSYSGCSGQFGNSTHVLRCICLVSLSVTLINVSYSILHHYSTV